MQEVASYKPVMYRLEPGDKVEYNKTYKRGIKRKKIVHNCIVVSETERLIILDTGNYRITVDKRDIGKDVQLYRLEDKNMFKNEPKITPEQLLEECRTHGIDKDAEKTIAILYGLSPLTIKQYISQWKIKDKLNAEQQPSIAGEPISLKDDKWDDEQEKEQLFEELAMAAERAADEFAAETEPKPNLDLLRTRYIGVTGEVFDYEIRQGCIKVYDEEHEIGLFTIEEFAEIIKELHTAIAIHKRLF